MYSLYILTLNSKCDCTVAASAEVISVKRIKSLHNYQICTCCELAKNLIVPGLKMSPFLTQKWGIYELRYWRISCLFAFYMFRQKDGKYEVAFFIGMREVFPPFSPSHCKRGPPSDLSRKTIWQQLSQLSEPRAGFASQRRRYSAERQQIIRIAEKRRKNTSF